MAGKYTPEELQQLDKDKLIEMTLSLQNQLERLDRQQQLILEQLADHQRRRFGRSSEKMETDNQISFVEVDGELSYFNEAEAVATRAPEVPDDEVPAQPARSHKKAGKREEDLKGLPTVTIEHTMTDEELTGVFGGSAYRRLPDEVYRRYAFAPAKVEVEEHHVAVYAGGADDTIVRAKHPAYLLRNSMVSPSLEAAIINAKYVNAVPLYRQEQDMQRKGLPISRNNMANWTIQCAERYLSVLYDFLHEKLYDCHVLQADETPVLVNKDGRPAGTKSYMWVYRTGQMYADRAIVLYEYQRTRNTSHPREFLKDFSGVCLTDGYQVYHTLEKERQDLRIAGCWAHCRRRFDEAVKAMPKASRKGCLAFRALAKIQAIYREENLLKDLDAGERLERRQLSVAPLVNDFFEWAKTQQLKVASGSKTREGFNYALNQERYLRVFLEDGEVPLDNNSAERSIRSFCVGKKNWVMIDTVAGAKASAMIYSLAETAKANNLKPYEYFKHLLEVIPEHMDDQDRSFCEDLLPWSEKLPAECRKPSAQTQPPN